MHSRQPVDNARMSNLGFQGARHAYSCCSGVLLRSAHQIGKLLFSEQLLLQRTDQRYQKINCHTLTKGSTENNNLTNWLKEWGSSSTERTHFQRIMYSHFPKTISPPCTRTFNNYHMFSWYSQAHLISSLVNRSRTHGKTFLTSTTVTASPHTRPSNTVRKTQRLPHNIPLWLTKNSH